MPALPDPFPAHSNRKCPPLTDRAMSHMYLNWQDITLWIFGGACSDSVKKSLRDWQRSLREDFASRDVYKKLTPTSTERLALAYFFDVLFLNSLQEEILKEGQDFTAKELCVCGIPCCGCFSGF